MKWRMNEANYNRTVWSWLFSFTIHAGLALLVVSFLPKLPTKKGSITVSTLFKNSVAPSVHSHENMPAQKHVKPGALVKTRAASKISTKRMDSSDKELGNTSASDLHASEQSISVVRAVPKVINNNDITIPYPEEARQLMIEGIVKMRLTVSEAGHVVDAQIVSGPHHGLRNAALIGARKLFFLPATDEHGHARSAQVEHEIVFRLQRQS